MVCQETLFPRLPAAIYRPPISIAEDIVLSSEAKSAAPATPTATLENPNNAVPAATAPAPRAITPVNFAQ